ncbi:MAG TPA: ABC transporter permease [Vicinamibacterales bacterium]|nr:ABC transporter permease [Vicinamibacterales bacterium]
MAKDIAVATPSLGAEAEPQGRGRWSEFGRKWWILIRRNPLGFFGLVTIIVLGVVALAGPPTKIFGLPVFGPGFAPYGLNEFTAGQPNEAMSWAHPFGTDRIGRDILSRDIYGAQISLSVAFISVLGGSAIGTAFGIISGYVGGLLDSAIQRAVDTAIAFPGLLLLLIIVQVLGPSFWTVVFAIMLGIIPGVTRVIRGAALSEKNNQYVEAARSIGASTPRILFRHILPNVLALAIVIMTTLLGAAILAEASLSFLGLGIPEPAASWGRDVSQARNSFPINIPAAFFPGAAIALTVFGFNMLGDAIRDIADPRLRGSQS